MVFFILTLAFSLTSAGILNANITIGMAAYAKKSKGSSDGSSGGGSGGSGSSNEDGGSRSTPTMHKNN
jgi:hypothetical protein